MKEDKISMTVMLPKEDRKLLKKLAVDLDTTASALISRWLHEYLEDAAGGPQETEA